MPVVTIDAKAELAQIRAAMDAEAGIAPPPEPEKPADPAPAEPPTPAKPDDDDEDDFAGKLKLTPEQHKAFTDIMNKRIGKKVRETREAEEFAAAQYNEAKLAERRAAELERQLSELKAKTPAQTQDDPNAGKPKREDFDSDQAWSDAYIDWRADMKAEAKFREKQEEAARAAAAERWAESERAAEERVTAAIAGVPDFKEKVGNAEVEIPGAMNEPGTAAWYVRQSPMISELLYYFAEHPAEAKKLAGMSQAIQLVTIGKIESTLKPFGSSGSKANGGAKPSESEMLSERSSSEAASSEAGTSPSRARSSAPVITPLNGNGASGGSIDPEHMTIRQHIADFHKRNPSAHLNVRKRH